LTDAYGGGISGTLVLLSLYSDSGCSNIVTSIGLSGNTATTNSSGYASISGFQATKVGSYYVKASAAGLFSSCSTNVLTVTQGTLSTLSYITQPSGTATAGTSYSFQPLLFGVDSFGNAAAFLSVTLTAFTDSACTASAVGTLANPTQSTNGTGYVSFGTSTWTSTIAGQTIYFKATSGIFNFVICLFVTLFKDLLLYCPLDRLALLQQLSIAWRLLFNQVEQLLLVQYLQLSL